MPVADLKALSKPLSGGLPAGENLEYDPRFLALVEASFPTAERQYGNTLVEAEAPNWSKLLEETLAICTETRDLRLGAIYTESNFASHGFEGLAQGLTLIEKWLTGLWAEVHPQPDADEPHDATQRISALGRISHPEHLVAKVQAAPLAACPKMGKVTLNDVRGANSSSSDTGLSASEIEAIFLSIDTRELQDTAQNISQCIESAQNIEESFHVHEASECWDSTPLTAVLKSCRSVLLRAAKRTSPVVNTNVSSEIELETINEDVRDETEIEQEILQEVTDCAGELRVENLKIETRADAMAALDSLCRYFQNHEPASPVPLLLERAKRLIPMSFVDILRELAPDGLSQAMQSVGASSVDK